MAPARKPDDLDRMLDRLEEAATVVTAVIRPQVRITMSKGAFTINVNWKGARIEYEAADNGTPEEIQHLLVELEQYYGSDKLPTTITIPRS